jgi:ABC-type transport system substrate-binding protein
MEPIVPIVYPETGEAPCGEGDYTGNLKKISALDDRTVEFQLCGPDVAFLAKVAFAVFAIQDQDYLEAHMADGSILAEPNGTGPYMLDEWLRANRLVLAANPDYWGTAPRTENVEFRWSDQAAQRWLELQAGTIDGMDNPATGDFTAIEGDSNVVFYEREGLNTLYVGMNVLTEPWDDVRVRQAIAQGIDRDRIVDNFYPPGSEVATHFTPCAIPFACGGEETWDFDPEAAKALLEEADFDFTQTYPIQFRAAVRGYLPDPPQIATEIQSQLRDNLGIQTELDLQESAAFLDANAAGTLDGLFLLGWGADYPDTSNFMDYHFGSGSGAKFGEPFDDIASALERGLGSADPTVREEAYTEANNLLEPLAVG